MLLLGFRVEAFPVHCKGSFKANGEDVLAALGPLMDRLGFARPVATGSFCGLFERPDAAMVCSRAPKDGPARLMFFRLGAADEGTARRILGEIATASSLQVKINKWHPAAP